MKTIAFLVLSALAIQPIEAAEWKVGAVDDSSGAAPTIILRTRPGEILVIGAADTQVLRRITSNDTLAIWYDDRVLRSYGREWMDQMDALCSMLCSDTDITGPVMLLAAGGAGYLASLPFEEHAHVVNIQFRIDGAAQVLQLKTNALDFFWLMNDVGAALNRKWLNIAKARAELYWSSGFVDRSKAFDRNTFLGTARLNESYDVMFWQEDSTRGIVLLFGKPEQGNPPLVAAAAAAFEATPLENYPPEYCTDRGGNKQLWRFGMGHQLFTVLATAPSCPERRID